MHYTIPTQRGYIHLKTSKKKKFVCLVETISNVLLNNNNIFFVYVCMRVCGWGERGKGYDDCLWILHEFWGFTRLRDIEKSEIRKIFFFF